MCNSIFLGKKTLEKAKDGEEVEVTIKGVYRTEDGVRKLDVEKVDGDQVGEAVDCGCDEHDPMDAEDAMKIFFIKKRKE